MYIRSTDEKDHLLLVYSSPGACSNDLNHVARFNRQSVEGDMSKRAARLKETMSETTPIDHEMVKTRKSSAVIGHL